ncbi:MAG: diguanylate cyclase, partial [Candidatus Omnitrophica bacterium]|nr:diguanylate cyclase [Candidatus Omnitrophota bacterium]
GYHNTSFELDSVRKGVQDYVIKDQVTRHLLVQVILHAVERQRLKDENKTLMDQFERLSLLDSNTELLNRRGLEKIFSREIAWLQKNHSILPAILLDLDDFKQVNDLFGYTVGDEVLRQIAHKLLAALRATDYVFRIGGDEFMVLLPGTPAADSVQVAEKIRLAISEKPIQVGSEKIEMTASLGLIQVNEHTGSVENLIARAHDVLSLGKEEGKNRVSSVLKEENSVVTPHKLIDEILDQVRSGKSFYVVKQPIFRLKDKHVIGYEFLSRSSVEVFKNPGDFFRLGSEYNILGIVDHHCFRNCIRTAAELTSGIKKHINVYPSTLVEIGAKYLLDEFPPEANLRDFCIEISEELIVANPANLIKPIQELRRSGLAIAIDNVAFGKSSLESLVLLEPDMVKVDKKWIIGLSKDKDRMRALERMLKVARALETTIIAEGIETQEDLKVLKSLGISHGQGFLLATPAE